MNTQENPVRYALLIARQRSGTGALGSIIDKHPALKYLGEVFHPSNYGHDDNFFTFYVKFLSKNQNFALPDERYSVFEAFLAEQYEKLGGRIPVVDVKYRSLHHLDSGWRGLVECPRILQQTMIRKLPIIHLTRMNSVQSFVSGRLAEENQVWHARKDQAVDVQSTTINVRALSNYIVNTSREVNLVDEWMADYSAGLRFDYENMMDEEGRLSPDIAARLSQILDIPDFQDREPSFKKQAPKSLKVSIENIEVVRKALIGTEFSWMLD
ncbi:MAG: Stf0 sulfotransferase family protein [bacterium]|nr:Stf0 sulfotransferase family protein [bacterium]